MWTMHGVFTGEMKDLLLAFEVAGTLFGDHKLKGGFSSHFVGFQLRYDLIEVGISSKRGSWIVQWIVKARSNKFVVQARDFSEFLGRLGFIAQLLVYLVETSLVTTFRMSSGCSSGDGISPSR